MDRYAGYIRVSTSAQVDKGESLPEQREQISKYCSAMNYNLTKIYEDGGISGGSLERPALDRMIEDARDGKFNKIVFKKMSRFGRNARDLLNLFDFLHPQHHFSHNPQHQIILSEIFPLES